MFDHKSFQGHEKVVFASDEATGLKAIVAIHSTALGPAAGGCRFWKYDSVDEALGDALRLSRGMSYKNAMADLPMGGGKAVILDGPGITSRDEMFAAFGRLVGSLNGDYITAEDVGVSVSDMLSVQTQTRFVSGIGGTGVGGDPSPYTARGVRLAVEAMIQSETGRSDLEGLKVAVQGVGHVGYHFCRELHERGCRLIVADINAGRVEQACDEFAAESCDIGSVLLQDVDVVSPCALGGAITADVARSLSAKFVIGAANNQLFDAAAGLALFERGISYAPDYVANAGGIISVAEEYLGGDDDTRVLAKVDAIYDRILDVQRRSKSEGVPSHVVADALAQEKIHGKRNSSSSPARPVAKVTANNAPAVQEKL